ncbi:hypothetical protein EPUL_002138, partial [Erysiphe pulchra]
MSVAQIISTKLKGTENYALWALRMSAYLRRQGFISITETDNVNDEINQNALADIELCLEDGPLLQIQHITRAHELWISLKNLYTPNIQKEREDTRRGLRFNKVQTRRSLATRNYNLIISRDIHWLRRVTTLLESGSPGGLTPKGFSADFYLIKEFFNCKLSNFNSMEEFLNTSRRLLDSLNQRGIDLPKKMIFTHYLNNLTSSYENIVSNIMQTLRNYFDTYTLDELFSNLLDEANRLQSRIETNETALVLSTNKKIYKPKFKKPYKVTKGLLCRHCHRTNHNTTDCLDLFPDKAPKKWKKLSRNLVNDTSHIPKESEVVNNENLLMSHEEIPLIIYEDTIDYNVSQEPHFNVLTLQSADSSSDVIRQNEHA